MKKIKLLFCFFLLTFPFTLVEGQSWDWGRQGLIRGIKPGPVSTIYVATDTTGNAYVTGAFEPSLRFLPDSIEDSIVQSFASCFVAKFNSLGTTQWLIQFDSYDGCTAGGAAIATNGKNNVWVSGGFFAYLSIPPYYFNLGFSLYPSGVFLTNLDDNGNVKWAIMGNDSLGKISLWDNTFDSKGNSFVCGSYYGIGEFGTNLFTRTPTNNYNVYMAKFDGNGNYIWYGRGYDPDTLNSVNDCGHAVATDLAGNAFMTGNYYKNIVFGSDTLTSTFSNSALYGNVFLVKYDSSGNFLWAKQSLPARGSNGGIGYSVTTDVAGSAYVTGLFNDSIQFGAYKLHGGGVFFVKYNAAGNVVWAKSFVGNQSGSVSSDQRGHVFISWGQNIQNTIINKFDTAGNFMCSSILRNGEMQANNQINSSASDPTGNYVYTANQSFSDTVTCNHDTMVGTNGTFLYVARWLPCDVCALANASISAPSSICKGDTAVITAIPSGSSTTKYLWSPGGQTSQTILVSPGSSTKYVVTINDTVGLCSLKDSVTIHVNPLPHVTLFVQSIDTICNNSGKLFLFGGPSGGTYGGIGVYGNYFYPDSATAGKYSVFYYSYTDTDGCTGIAKDSVYVMVCEGINEVKGESGKLKVYPNPFTSTTTITVNSTGEYYMELTDVTGRKLKSLEFTGNEYTLSAEGLASGMYFMRIFDRDKNVVGTMKVVVQ
jgi:hypothetical protein